MRVRRFIAAVSTVAALAATPVLIAAPSAIVVGVSPAAIVAGESDVLLVITGANFLPGDEVRINGVERPSQLLDPRHLAVEIPQADLATPRTLNIAVARGGGSSSVPVVLHVQPNAPSISSMSPSSVAAGGDEVAVTVFGSGFAPASVVRVNGEPRPTTFVDSTQLTANLSSASVARPGVARVNVSNPNNRVSTVVPLMIALAGLPEITVVTPRSVPASGAGAIITVAGSHFSERSVVLIDGVPHATLYINSRTLAAQIGPSETATPGALSVAVANPNGVLSTERSITLTAADTPSVDSLSPASVSAGQSALVLGLAGSHFGIASVVRVNGSDRPTTLIDDSHLTATLFAADLVSAGMLSVAVENTGLNGGHSELAMLTIRSDDAPTISGVQPASIEVGAPIGKLTLRGASFRDGDTVLISDVPRTTEFISSSEIAVSLEPQDIVAGERLSVTVERENGTRSAPSRLNVNRKGAPSVTALDPAIVPVGSNAFTLTVTGGHFVTDSIIAIDGVPRPSHVLSPTQISVDLAVSDLASTRQMAVAVINPGDNPSLPVSLIVGPLPPSIEGITFSAPGGGAGGFTLTVSGTGFTEKAIVKVNGRIRQAEFDAASGQLVVKLTAEDMAALRSLTVVVPGAGEASTSLDASTSVSRSPASKTGYSFSGRTTR